MTWYCQNYDYVKMWPTKSKHTSCSPMWEMGRKMGVSTHSPGHTHPQGRGWVPVWLGSMVVVVEPIFKQVCIPVGCVLPACCPYLPACTALGGVCSRGGLPLVLGGVCPGREGISQHAMGQTPPPVDTILDTRFWKYYLTPTSLRAVIKTQRNHREFYLCPSVATL